jgi:hypothetical protein
MVVGAGFCGCLHRFYRQSGGRGAIISGSIIGDITSSVLDDIAIAAFGGEFNPGRRQNRRSAYRETVW